VVFARSFYARPTKRVGAGGCPVVKARDGGAGDEEEDVEDRDAPGGTPPPMDKRVPRAGDLGVAVVGTVVVVVVVVGALDLVMLPFDAVVVLVLVPLVVEVGGVLARIPPAVFVPVDGGDFAELAAAVAAFSRAMAAAAVPVVVPLVLTPKAVVRALPTEPKNMAGVAAAATETGRPTVLLDLAAAGEDEVEVFEELKEDDVAALVEVVGVIDFTATGLGEADEVVVEAADCVVVVVAVGAAAGGAAGEAAGNAGIFRGWGIGGAPLLTSAVPPDICLSPPPRLLLTVVGSSSSLPLVALLLFCS